MVLPGTLFEELGFNYIGPHRRPRRESAGEDPAEPAQAARAAVPARGDAQGQGLRARRSGSDQVARPGSVRSGQRHHFQGKASTGPTYSQIFGKWLCDMAARDPTIIGVTPAMREGSGLVEFSKRFPERYFDVAIAEQHAVTFAAGLAVEGLKPIVAIYSTFLQRAYDQLIHDVALQNLPVVFAWIAPASSAATAPPTRAATISPSCAVFRTW
jgi:1-deoxy-D-xylulose-5-phosphate synthase